MGIVGTSGRLNSHLERTPIKLYHVRRRRFQDVGKGLQHPRGACRFSAFGYRSKSARRAASHRLRGSPVRPDVTPPSRTLLSICAIARRLTPVMVTISITPAAYEAIKATLPKPRDEADVELRAKIEGMKRFGDREYREDGSVRRFASVA